MTQRQTMDAIRALGLSVRRTEHGEYRVNFKSGTEGTAYYTTDAEDALGTARAMLKEASS